VDANPEHHFGFFGNAVISFAEDFLKFNSRIHRIDHAIELSDDGIASGMENPAAMLLDYRIDQATANLDILKSQLFILVHQLAESHAISGYDCREFPGQFCSFHGLGMAQRSV
jgi:hypothetical protein